MLWLRNGTLVRSSTAFRAGGTGSANRLARVMRRSLPPCPLRPVRAMALGRHARLGGARERALTARRVAAAAQSGLQERRLMSEARWQQTAYANCGRRF